MFNFPLKERNEELQYKRNFLKTVIFRIDYPLNEEIVKNKEELKKRFSQQYPIYEELLNAEGLVRFDEKSTPVFYTKGTTEDGVSLKSKDSTKLDITRRYTSLTINGSSYKNFKKLLEHHIREILNVLREYNVSELERVGLRKINLIGFKLRDDDKDKVDIVKVMPSIFNSTLCESLQNFPGGGKNISQTESTVVMESEKYKMNLKYGFTPTDLEKYQWRAFLDIDIYSLSPDIDVSKSQNMEQELTKINQEIFNAFHWSLQESLIEQLKS